MKKLAIFLAIMLIPFSAFALDTISDNDLNDVTGQAGVSIYTNSIQIVKTGVTTTYTDNDPRATKGGTNQINIVDIGSTTQIFFGGIDPLMIDIGNMNYVAAELAGATGVTPDTWDYGDTCVAITLPDAIYIVNAATSVKEYYAGTALTNGNQIIAIGVTGGTTTIEHADKGWSTRPIPMALGGPMSHDDQIKILITAHGDKP